MRKWMVLTMITVLTIPAQAAKRVNIKQLDQSLTEAIDHSTSGSDILRVLSQLQLTERMSIKDLQRWQARMPDNPSRQALAMVADSSVFLNPPADEISSNPAPDKEEQQKLLAMALDYVDKTLAKLPNFFAAEAITLFEDTPPGNESGGHGTAYQPMHFVSQTKATVLYRGGKEIMEGQAGQLTEGEQLVSSASGLLSSGQFGPVLKTVLTDSGKGKLSWGRWESGSTSKDGVASPLAVFRYSVPRKESHYRIKVELEGTSKPRQSRPGYHGEIAVDPSSGTILRLTLRADTTDEDALSAADMMVEYGSVDIGAKTYICPIRSVAIVNTILDELMYSGGGGAVDRGRAVPNLNHAKDENTQTLLNDVTFERYHVLRSEARILTPADLNDDGTNP